MLNKNYYKIRRAQNMCGHCGKVLIDKNFKSCEKCRNYAKKYYQKDKSKYRNKSYSSAKHQQEYKRKIKEEVIKKYGGKCACCNEEYIEYLTIDHTNGDGGEERRKLFGSNKGCQTYTFYLMLKREPLRSDLQVLCYNCNISIAHYGYSPLCKCYTRKITPHHKH